MFSYFFQSSDSGDSIYDGSMGNMANNKLIWLSYISPKKINEALENQQITILT
jgi:hypothetical protein